MARTSGIARTTDGGATWTTQFDNGKEFIAFSVVSPELIYAAAEDGVYRYGDPQVSVLPALKADLFNVHPNPFTNMFEVEGIPSGESVRVFDLVGREIYSMVATNNHLTIDLSGKPQGIYLLRSGKESERILKH